ncbi:MAG: hypothetical protein A2283_18805 [Lentisphaerae bacterium RIFOXYA12_FULL_48_11]|nr:MAG: hypothetical protein A2283_18805 [Lentisphaerae bacterium RIFOXYA12_FULL_48_11]
MSGKLSGQNRVSLDELQRFQVPAQTESYVPLPHYDMAMNLQTVATDMFTPKGYVFVKGEYATARDGQRVFGVLQFKNGITDMGMAVGFRNSYDRSMSAGVVIGAQVFVCDNMCFRGEITVMRKHTKNIIEGLQTELVAAIYSSVGNFELIHTELERLKTVEISDEFGFRTLGSLAGNEVLTPTELNEAFRQWKEPQYESFKPRTAYSLYNAVTCGLRDIAPHRTFQVHRDVHEAIIAEYLPPAPSAN